MDVASVAAPSIDVPSDDVSGPVGADVEPPRAAGGFAALPSLAAPPEPFLGRVLVVLVPIITTTM